MSTIVKNGNNSQKSQQDNAPASLNLNELRNLVAQEQDNAPASVIAIDPLAAHTHLLDATMSTWAGLRMGDDTITIEIVAQADDQILMEQARLLNAQASLYHAIIFDHVHAGKKAPQRPDMAACVKRVEASKTRLSAAYAAQAAKADKQAQSALKSGDALASAVKAGKIKQDDLQALIAKLQALAA